VTADFKALAAANERLVARGFYMHPVAGKVTIADAVRRAVTATRSYTPEELGRLTASLPNTARRPETRIEVTGESSLEAAYRVVADGHTSVGVLNFASARRPGGGYLTGARAQEEDLCRCSALYTCLIRAPDYYAAHEEARDPFYSHRLICSPRVPVFRDPHGELLPEPYHVTFLTCPAPNAGEVARQSPERLSEIPRVLRARSAVVLAAAVSHGLEALVLGAWGCGVFRNSPHQVAAAFQEHLVGGMFSGRFEHVAFAVYDRAPGQPNLDAFKAAFGSS
jgi:uncharacterized protein (TIGR02452 family)